MAKFLNTSATNYYLEELIKQTRERLIIISPFLKFNDRIKELLADKDRMKIDVRLVYGKSELAPQEINWLRSLEFVRTSFCQNLHAKCYLNEEAAIITSMNLSGENRTQPNCHRHSGVGGGSPAAITRRAMPGTHCHAERSAEFRDTCTP